MDANRWHSETGNQRGAKRQGGTADWAGLMPVGVVTFGPPSAPCERAMGAQAAAYRLIVWLGGLRLPRVRLPQRETTRRSVAGE